MTGKERERKKERERERERERTRERKKEKEKGRERDKEKVRERKREWVCMCVFCSVWQCVAACCSRVPQCAHLDSPQIADSQLMCGQICAWHIDVEDRHSRCERGASNAGTLPLTLGQQV